MLAAAFAAGLVQELRKRLAVGDVQRITRHRAELVQRGHRCLERVDVAVADHHPRSALQQRLGGGVSDAAGGAGDRDGLAADVFHARKLYMPSRAILVVADQIA